MGVANRFQLSLDLKKSNVFTPKVTANDHTVFEFAIKDGMESVQLLDVYRYVFVVKPSGQDPLLYEATLNEKGLVEVELNFSNFKSGIFECVLQIYDADNERISTMNMVVDVKKDLSLQGYKPSESNKLVIVDEKLLTKAIDIVKDIEKVESNTITDDYINVLKPPAPFLPLQTGLFLIYRDSNSVRLQAMLDNVAQTGRRKIFFPIGVYGFNIGLVVKDGKVQFVGDSNDIVNRHGSQLVYYGEGDFFKFGKEIPLNQYGDNLYDGLEGVSFKNILLDHHNPDTPINNESASRGNKYKSGSKAIADYGGGTLTLENTTIQHFEYGVYLVQSDFNTWTTPSFLYNKCGVYLSSRSDQNIWIRPDFTHNEMALWNDGASNLTLYSPNFVKNGIGGIYGDIPVVSVTGGYITMYSPWVESYNVRDEENIPSFIRAGIDVGWRGTLSNCGITIYNPLVTSRMHYMFEFNKANIELHGIKEVTRELESLALKSGSEQGSFYYDLGNTQYDLSKILKYTSDGSNAYKNGALSAYNQMHFSGTRFHFSHPDDSLKNISFESTDPGRFSLSIGANNIFRNIEKTTYERASMPVDGVFNQGDYCKNNTPKEIGETGKKYIILGWICITGGSSSVWKECRVLTGD